MIGTRPTVSLPLLSDTLATLVSKVTTSINNIADSIADKATPAGLNVNAPLSLAGNTLINVASLALVAGTLPTAPGSMYYSGGEFYLIDSTGAVQVTSLGQLNHSAFGVIGGDYGGANPALISYDTATQQYRFYVNGSTHTWASLVAKTLILEDTGSGNTATITPPAMTGSYTLTLPTVLPGVVKGLAMAPSGQLEYLDADFKTLIVPSAAAQSQATYASPSWTVITTPLVYPVTVPANATITGWTLYLKKGSNATFTVTAQMRKWVQDTVTNFTAQNNAVNAPGYITLGESGVSHAVSSGEQWEVIVSDSGATSLDFSYQLEVSYKFYL